MSSISWVLLPFVVQIWVATPVSKYEDPAEVAYQDALQHFKEKKWKKAKVGFEKAFTLLGKKKTTTPRQKQLLDLGISDVLYHLAQIRWRDGLKRNACRTLDNSLKRWTSLPKNWQTWNINRLLPGRFTHAQKLFATTYQCKTKVPSVITFQGLPPKSEIAILVPMKESPTVAPVNTKTKTSKASPAKTKQPIAKKTVKPVVAKNKAPSTAVVAKAKTQWKIVQSPISVYHSPAKFRFRSKGYKDKFVTIDVPAWSELQKSISLKLLPKKRKPPPRRDDKKIKPPPKKPFPWLLVAGIGTVVVGGVVTGVVLGTRKDTRLQVQIKPGQL